MQSMRSLQGRPGSRRYMYGMPRALSARAARPQGQGLANLLRISSISSRSRTNAGLLNTSRAKRYENVVSFTWHQAIRKWLNAQVDECCRVRRHALPLIALTRLASAITRIIGRVSCGLQWAEFQPVVRQGGGAGQNHFFRRRCGAGAPRSKPSVLRSSSTSGQWIPYPPPAIFQ
jgi:hypothetical protein